LAVSYAPSSVSTCGGAIPLSRPGTAAVFAFFQGAAKREGHPGKSKKLKAAATAKAVTAIVAASSLPLTGKNERILHVQIV
jgi:hypothetical protein